MDKRSLNEAEKEEQNRKDELEIKKSKLRTLAKTHGNQTIISIARGNGENNMITLDE